MNSDRISLDKILSSSGRVRILTALSNASELHLTEIARRTDQSYTATERHLKDLAQAEIVEEHDYGRVRIFKLNLENPKTRKLKELILDWDNGEHQTKPSSQQAS
ncbi:MAG TPA: winged helix-turn-helix domain-containing protein [Candidatus Bathyarchaeia archaeon]|nr:winged helix-turn-helix domain-containing protein [Candidatus Bathyarchaeia archaeon]